MERKKEEGRRKGAFFYGIFLLPPSFFLRGSGR